MCPAPAGTRVAAASSDPTEPSWQQLAAAVAWAQRSNRAELEATFERATHIGATHGLSGAPAREPAVAEKKQNKSHGRDEGVRESATTRGPGRQR